MTDAAKQKRAENLRSSIEVLRERGIPFERLNNGFQIVIRVGSRTWDFWPTKGRWRERVTDAKPGSFALSACSRVSGRGVFNLLKQLGEENK
jgi:hypothetical protein